MYGVPAVLPVERFVGHELNQVCLGRFQVQFHCATGGISVEGRWELRDKTGTLIDSARDHSERPSYQIHRILDVSIERAAVDPPRSFALFFAGGLTLTVFDDSEEYESFSIHLDGEPSIYV